MPGPTERSTVDFRSFLEAGFEWRTIFVDVLRRLKEEEILELKDLEANRFRFTIFLYQEEDKKMVWHESLLFQRPRTHSLFLGTNHGPKGLPTISGNY